MKSSAGSLVVCLALLLPALASAAESSGLPLLGVASPESPPPAEPRGESLLASNAAYAAAQAESPYDEFGSRLVGTTAGGVFGLLGMGALGMATGFALDRHYHPSPPDEAGRAGAILGAALGGTLGVVPGVLAMAALTGTRGSIPHALLGQLVGTAAGLALVGGVLGDGGWLVGASALVLMPALGAALGFQLGAPSTAPTLRNDAPQLAFGVAPLRDGAAVALGGCF